MLAHKVERYNQGDSSIPIEKAQDIMTSNEFTIGLWLKTFAVPDDAVSALRKEPVRALYQKGRERIDTMLTSAKSLHRRLSVELVNSPNVFYRPTLRDAVLGFFKRYDPDYAAQEFHITADYPLFSPRPALAGIEFIQAYVEAAFCENRFGRLFSAQDIHALLLGYDASYPSLLMNLYEPVLTAALGCIIAGLDPVHLRLTDEAAGYLHRQFSRLTKAEIAQILYKAAAALIGYFQIPDEVADYIQSSLSQLATNIESAKNREMLGHLFFPPGDPK